MNEEIIILAKTIYGEARGEKTEGMEAVANVILNRVKFAEKRGGYWWGNTVKDVCLKPWQFSCWNSNDPNCKKLESLTEQDELFCLCVRIANRALKGLVKDNTFASTHYHVKRLNPKWAYGKVPCKEIGNHFFYNDIEEEKL